MFRKFINSIQDYILITIFLLINIECNAEDLERYVARDYSIIPPSPEVSALTESHDFEVDLYHGRPNIEFTLYTIKDAELEHPIKLRYNSGGIRTNEDPGILGYGWTIDASAVVSRTVYGLPDDYNYGGGLYGLWYSTEETKKLRTLTLGRDITYNPSDKMAYIDNSYDIGANATGYYEGRADLANDVFNVSGCGASAVFIFDEKRKAHIASSQGMKLEVAYMPTKCNIEKADGTTLDFEIKETTKVECTLGDPRLFTEPNTIYHYTSAWYLNQLRDSNGNTLIFSYTQLPDKLVKSVSATKYDIHMDQNSSPYFPIPRSISTDKITYSPLVLSRIMGRYVIVYFRYNETTHLLDSIIVQNSDGVVVKNYAFDYTESFLLRVKEDGYVKYEFEYDENLAFGQDYAGYPNGYITDPVPNSIDRYGKQNRYVDGDNATARSLTKITYSTGGFDEFVWESNDYSYIRNYGIEAEDAVEDILSVKEFILTDIDGIRLVESAEFNYEAGDKLLLDINKYFNFDRSYFDGHDFNDEHFYTPGYNTFSNMSKYPAVAFYRLANNAEYLEKLFFIDEQTLKGFNNGAQRVALTPGRYVARLLYSRNVYLNEEKLNNEFRYELGDNGKIYISHYKTSPTSTSGYIGKAYAPGLRIRRIKSNPNGHGLTICKDFFYPNENPKQSSGVIQDLPNFWYYFYITVPDKKAPGETFNDIYCTSNHGLPSTPYGHTELGYREVVTKLTAENDRNLPDIGFTRQFNRYKFSSPYDNGCADIINSWWYDDFQPMATKMRTSRIHMQGNLLEHQYTDAYNYHKESTEFKYNIFEKTDTTTFTTTLFLLADHMRIADYRLPRYAVDYGIGKYRLIPYTKTVASVTDFEKGGIEHTKKYEYFYDSYTASPDYALVKTLSEPASDGRTVNTHYTYKYGKKFFLPTVETEIKEINGLVVGGRRTEYEAGSVRPVATYTMAE